MSVEVENGEPAVDIVEEQPEVEIEDQEQPAEGETDDETKPEDDAETVIAFADSAPKETEEQESSVLREVRKKMREHERRAKAAEAELAQLKAPAKPKLGPKPTLEASDYDSDKHEQALEQWLKQKAAVDAEEAEARRAQERQAEEWGQTVQKYREGKQALRRPDFDDAEANVVAALDMVQQNIILAAADRPEALIYALGRDEAKLAEVAKIKDAVKFTAKIAKLETTLTVATKTKTPPPPARSVNGNAPTTATGNSIKRALEKAEKSDDVTDLVNAVRDKKGK